MTTYSAVASPLVFGLCMSCLCGAVGLGCGSGPTGDADRRQWDSDLRQGHGRYSNYDRIHCVGDASVITGYRLWQGRYRSVPLALYSRVTNNFSPPWGPSSLRCVDIVLTVEEAGPPPGRNSTGPSIERIVIIPVAEKRYPAGELDLANYCPHPANPNLLDPGALGVDVRDDGNGKLGFQVNVLKQRHWDTFDLETCLGDHSLTGPKTIDLMPPPPYTPEQFAKAMIRKLSQFAPVGDPRWPGEPTSKEAAAVDHPLWNDPSAMNALLTAAPQTELANALRFMAMKQRKDVRYMVKLNELRPIIVSLAKRDGQPVRRAVIPLLAPYPYWPKDVVDLEPLLASTDDEIVRVVLNAMQLWNHIPADIKRVKELSLREDQGISMMARKILDRATGNN